MSPTQKYLLKCILFGAYSVLTYLAAAQVADELDWNSLLGALIAGGIGGLGYAGIGYGTSLEAPGSK